MNHFIPLSVPNIKGNEKKYIDDAIAQEWVSTGGAYIDRFEREFAAYVGSPAAVACQSGTAGLHLALIAAGIGVSHEVIVPTLTFVAAVNPVKYVGAEPVFMDCDDTLCMDMNKLERFCVNECFISDGKLINKRTGKHIAALIVVHVFGNLADMDKLLQIARKYNIFLIEDATEALGSRFADGKSAGTIGDMGVYSFNGNKIITTGGGGMIVSPDTKLLERAKHLSTQAKTDVVSFMHDEVGYNYRMTNLQAALGVGQLEQLEDFIKIKAENYHLYQKLGVSLLQFREDIRPNYWFYSHMTEKRDGLIEYLEANQVQSRPVWHLIHSLPFYGGNQSYRIEKARYYWERIVNIPCSSGLVGENVETVAKLVKSCEKLN